MADTFLFENGDTFLFENGDTFLFEGPDIESVIFESLQSFTSFVSITFFSDFSQSYFEDVSFFGHLVIFKDAVLHRWAQVSLFTDTIQTFQNANTFLLISMGVFTGKITTIGQLKNFALLSTDFIFSSYIQFPISFTQAASFSDTFEAIVTSGDFESRFIKYIDITKIPIKVNIFGFKYIDITKIPKYVDVGEFE